MADWPTQESIKAEWREAQHIDAAQLAALLAASREQCEHFGYAPSLDGAGVRLPGIPDRVRMAHLIQARALWNASQVGGGDQQGPDGSTVTVRPMDWQVTNLLRPRTSVPRLG